MAGHVSFDDILFGSRVLGVRPERWIGLFETVHDCEAILGSLCPFVLLKLLCILLILITIGHCCERREGDVAN